MPNIAAVLKEEIRRLAKKEIKAQVGTTKQAVVKYRSEIAKLKQGLSWAAPLSLMIMVVKWRCQLGL